mgnify:CR=1 FL=1
MYDFENMTDEEFESLCREVLPLQHESFILTRKEDGSSKSGSGKESQDEEVFHR